MTGQVAAVREFSLVVPAGWFCVPLPDDDERHRSIEALAEECFRGVDDQPVLRRQVRATVSGLAERAATSGGVQLYLALNTVAGVPLAASLLVSVSPVRGYPTSGSGGATADVLAAAMRRPGAQLEVVDLPAGLAVRRRMLRHQAPSDVVRPPDVIGQDVMGQRAPHGGREPVLGVTMLDYTVPLPGKAGVLVLSFSSPLEVLADALVELFDAVAGTLRWKS